ncbi:MAG: hypothetical protein AAB416_02010 [Patescibacteria group bacterium]
MPRFDREIEDELDYYELDRALNTIEDRKAKEDERQADEEESQEALATQPVAGTVNHVSAYDNFNAVDPAKDKPLAGDNFPPPLSPVAITEKRRKRRATARKAAVSQVAWMGNL